MKPYIQAKNGMPGNVIFYAAYQGFMEMGSECVLFHDFEELDTSCRGDVVVGGLGPLRHTFLRHGVEIVEYDYPEELGEYMGRRVWRSTMDEVAADSSLWPVSLSPQRTRGLRARLFPLLATWLVWGSLAIIRR